MPLYMDLHKGVPKLSKDEMKQIHQADLDVQDKFGVKYHKFWVNEEAGTIFCLVEGPNKDACIHTHENAHGLLPCEIIEVQPSDVALFMGESPSNDIGRAIHTDGLYDSSVRTFLFTDIVGSTDLTQSVGDAKAISIIRKHNEIVRSSLIVNNGKEVKHTGDGIMACFVSAFKAVNAAREIQKNLKNFRDNNPDYPLYVRIGLNTGEPVTEGNDFFGVAVQMAARLCNKAASNQVLVSNIVKDLCMGKTVNFIDQGQAELKGFSSPVSVYEVDWT
jgi:class 3 adenylate cyclase